MNKKLIRLTESDLHRIVKESLWKVLREVKDCEWNIDHDDNGYNYKNRNGEYLSRQRFDYAGPFRNGKARVGLNGRYNDIDTDGRILNPTWDEKY